MATTENKDDARIKKQYNFLYPLLTQPDFNIKIAEKREFNDTKYPDEVIDNIEAHGNFLCNEKEFELMPHQKFVRNFLSSMTPYNGVLLFHGLGTGKTCTAISVAEQTREYYKHLNSNKKIIIIASPNVKENFKTQLFDARKLKQENGVWNLRACTGKTYLREINPMSMKNLKKENIVKEVNKIIRASYRFLGYTEFANIIRKILSTTKSEQSEQRALRKYFSDTLIIIDEVHNIRHTAANPKKRVAINLLKVVQAAQNLKLLFLSATPMYNSHDEIIWLLNILNINDGRAPVLRKDVFDKKGDFLISSDGEETGKKYLASKCIGYISYLRGQNPYTFPYRLWPTEFAPKVSLVNILAKTPTDYPSKQINGEVILDPPKHLDLFLVHIQKYQEVGYTALLDEIKGRLSELKKADAALGYEMLGKAIQGLNLIYPYTTPITNTSLLYGQAGLKNTMIFSKKNTDFKYKNTILQEYGRIFSLPEIRKYSSKMAAIMHRIKKSEGIILIYSQFINAGCIPLALALEEMGIKRYGRKSLFKTPPHPPIDYRTMGVEPPTGENDIIPATYAMITGDHSLSPNKNKNEMAAITGSDNQDGAEVKVVIISKAGAEGLDFKSIRQIHILEPWFNLNRIEQVIGRGVRNCSHKALPFVKRNVEIYLYGTLLSGKDPEESGDMYIYRKAYDKAIQIGHVSRLLKENAIDCYLNSSYNNLSIDKVVKQQLSSTPTAPPINFNIKSKPYSALCDYMEKCKYNCVPVGEIREINDDTYNERFIIMNMDKIVERIRVLMKEQFLYKRHDLIARIRVRKDYPMMQINEALSFLIEDKNEFITDMFGRLGNLVNIGEYYMFQPLEIENTQISYFDRTHPLAYKRNTIDARSTRRPKPSSRRSIMDRLYEYQKCIYTEDSCHHLEYSESYAAIQFLAEAPFNLDRNILQTFMYSHIFDSLSYANKLELLNILWDSGRIQNDFNQTLKRVITTDFILEVTTGQAKVPKQHILPVVEKLANRKIEKRILILKDKWVLATKTDLVDLGHMYDIAIEDKYQKDNFNNIIGFMGTIKGSGFKFKVIDIKNKSKRSRRGFQCVTQQKQKTLELLNTLMVQAPIEDWRDLTFTEKDTKKHTDVLIRRGFSRHKLCNVQELIFRYYEHIDADHTWFLSTFGAKFNKIEE